VRSLLPFFARQVWLPLALLLGLAGCGDVDASAVSFPGTVVYESPSGSYHFHLLEPPWISISINNNSQVLFLVPPTDIAVTVSASAQEADALYSLRVTAQAGDAASNFQAHALQNQWDASKQKSITPVGGDAGIEINWQEAPAVYHREADIDGSTPGTSFLLKFTAKVPLDDDPMIDQMVLSFQPRPTVAGSP
jgi:hypothetical protein